MLWRILHIVGHTNCITGSRVMNILMNLWILLIVGAQINQKGIRDFFIGNN